MLPCIASVTRRVSVVSPKLCQNGLADCASAGAADNSAAPTNNESLRMEISFDDRERTLERPHRTTIVRWHDVARATLDEAANQHVEKGSEHQTEERHAKHPREHGHAHHVPHLGAGTAGENERHDAHDERERRHENGTETNAACLERGRQSIVAATLEIPRELDDQNRVLARETDQYEQSDLRENVVVTACHPHSGDRRQETHRHDEDDHERKRPTLVLRREHEEHEQHAKWENEHRRVAGELLLIRQLRPLEAHA